jgi:hypothetical protein
MCWPCASSCALKQKRKIEFSPSKIAFSEVPMMGFEPMFLDLQERIVQPLLFGRLETGAP